MRLCGFGCRFGREGLLGMNGIETGIESARSRGFGAGGVGMCICCRICRSPGLGGLADGRMGRCGGEGRRTFWKYLQGTV
jgi:hypothetical protein